MSSGGEGLLTLIFMVRVSPEPSSFQELISLLRTATAILNIEKKAHEKMGGISDLLNALR